MDTAGPAGFRGFVSARQAALLRSAYVLCGDRHRAEDLVQGALTRTAVLRETAVEHLPERPVPDRNDTVDLKLALRAALDRLAPRQRAVLALRFYEDLPRGRGGPAARHLGRHRPVHQLAGA